MTRALRQQLSRPSRSSQYLKTRRILSSAASLFAASLASHRAMAATGTWLPPFGGNYAFETPSNWINGSVPNTAGDMADFSRFNFQAGDITVTLNANRTIGTLIAGDLDVSSAINFIFAGPGVLTLNSPTQPVMNIGQLGVFGQFVRMDNQIAGTAGFNKTGV